MRCGGILPPERTATSYRDDPTPVASLLRMLCRHRPRSLALIGTRVDEGLRIEDISAGVRPGTVLQAPAGLLSDHGAVLDVSGERLSTGWMELCGWRPEYFAATPVANHPFQLVVVGCGGAPQRDELLDASIAMGSILDGAPATHRERNASQRIAALIDNLPLPIVFVDSRTIEVFLNDRARELLSFDDMVATEAEIAAAFARLMVGATVDRRAMLSTDPGADTRFEVESSGRLFEVESRWIDEERLTGRLWMFRDVTDERLTARLKDELVSTVSHELRTPLTSIVGSLGLLQSGMAGSLPEQSMLLVDVAHRNGARLSRLINDLLDLDRLQSGNLQLEVSEVDIGGLLQDSVRQNEPFAASYGVRLALMLPGERTTAHVDVDRILQVTTNLLSNAVKFAPSGSTVRICLSKGTEALRISVSDEGAGVSPDVRERLFRRFAQGGGALNQSGTGLGLAISKGIVEQHNGTIWLDTGTQIGATFHVELPLALVRAGPPSPR